MFRLLWGFLYQFLYEWGTSLELEIQQEQRSHHVWPLGSQVCNNSHLAHYTTSVLLQLYKYHLPPQLALLYCSQLFYKVQRTTLGGFSQRMSKCVADLSVLVVVYQPLLHNLELW